LVFWIVGSIKKNGLTPSQKGDFLLLLFLLIKKVAKRFRLMIFFCKINSSSAPAGPDAKNVYKTFF
jgi:hypothetical protein